MNNKVIKGKDPQDKKEVVLNSKCILDTNKYRVRDNGNRYLTTEMFYDHPDNLNKYNLLSPYSLYNHDDIVLDDGTKILSMRKIFLELNDSSGYQCAIVCLGCKEHWDKLVSNSKIGSEIQKWVEELQLKELSLIKKVCLSELSSMGKGAMQAAKILISLNNQDPNSLTNRDKFVAEKKSEKNNNNTKSLDSNAALEEQRKMMEDFKRLNS